LNRLQSAIIPDDMRMKPYKCELCCCSFTKRYRLVDHMKKCHPDQFDPEKMSSFKCNFCNAYFTLQHLVNQHIRKRHPDRALEMGLHEGYTL
jgi:hypothetical protein